MNNLPEELMAKMYRDAISDYRKFNEPLVVKNSFLESVLTYRGYKFTQKEPFLPKQIAEVCKHIDKTVTEICQDFTNPVYKEVFSNQKPIVDEFHKYSTVKL